MVFDVTQAHATGVQALVERVGEQRILRLFQVGERALIAEVDTTVGEGLPRQCVWYVIVEGVVVLRPVVTQEYAIVMALAVATRQERFAEAAMTLLRKEKR